MADTLQHGSISGSASVRQNISGEITIGGKIMKELRFLPYSEFPEIGREETIYIDTDNNAMYYYDGSAYVALSGGGGGGTDNYNALTNKPSVNSVTLIGNKTSSELGLQELISDLSTIRSGAALGTTAVQPETLETALSDKQDVINDLDDIRAGAELGETAVQPSDMESALADKQDTISDLATIRSGAAAGATAVQPDDMEAALEDKQDVISDLASIRSGASKGATAVQPSDMETALSGKQDTISDLQTIRSGAALGTTAVQPSDMETALEDKQDIIADLNDIRTGAGLGATAVQPADMETALANKQDVISDLDAIRSGATAGNTALQPGDIDTLPTDGSSNPVSSGGTYNFVNSSIATNTAYFIGTFASVAELEAYTGTVTNNDYAFVTSTDSAGNTLYNRYKYNAATQVWSFEYAVNNTAFTAAQWAAIQSGLTSSDKTKLDGIEQGANKTVIDAAPTSGSSNAVSSGGVHTALSGKQDTISDLSDIRSGASAGATAVQPAALNDYQTKLSGTNKLDPAYIEYDATHRAVTDTEKSTWNGKQSALTTEQLAAVNSGIDSADVAQIETNKNNISMLNKYGGGKNLYNPLTSSATSAYHTTNNAAINGAVSTTSNGNWARVAYPITLKAGTYTYSGNVTTTTGANVVRFATTSTGESGSLLVSDITISATGNISKSFTLTNDSTIYIIYYPNYSGTSANNTLTIANNMISASTDTTYQPYAMSNPVLTPAAIKAVDAGAKNLLKIVSLSQSNRNGVDYTLNPDGSVTVNGTPSGTAPSYVTLMIDTATAYDVAEFCDGKHIISGCPSGGGASSYRIQVAKYTYAVYDYGNGAVLSPTTLTGVYVLIYIPNGVTVNNLIFRPMICTASDWAVSQKFVPYAMSNVELTEQVDFLRGKMVYSTVRNSSYTSTYTMDINDFNGSQVGLYLIYIVNWSTTPSISIYAMAYSGNLTSQSTLSKIFGSDVSISLSGATVTYTGSGKIQIVAVR